MGRIESNPGCRSESQLLAGEPRRDVPSARESEPVSNSEDESASPAVTTPVDLSEVPERPEPTRTVESQCVKPQCSADVIIGDGERWPASLAGRAAILDEEFAWTANSGNRMVPHRMRRSRRLMTGR